MVVHHRALAFPVLLAPHQTVDLNVLATVNAVIILPVLITTVGIPAVKFAEAMLNVALLVTFLYVCVWADTLATLSYSALYQHVSFICIFNQMFAL